ncbi:MAG: CopG family transcriptional regulator [Myxococcaceae bacterium]
MVRIQLHLTSAQDRQLRAMARKRGTTRAELIRRGIDRLLAGGDDQDPLLALAGQVRGKDPGDVSENHDTYLYGAESYDVPVVAEDPQRRRRR